MPDACREEDNSRPEVDTPGLDQRIATVARAQHGVIAHRQLVGLGVSPRAIAHRAAAGRLHRIHRGVYAVGHTVLGPRGRWMAAVLSCGPRAALSHAAAAALWELRGSAAARTDVTVPNTSGRRRGDVRVHRSRSLRPDEVTRHHGIPVTTPARTILDMAARLQPAHLERLLDQAEIRELTDYPTLAALAAAHAGHHGAAKLNTALATHDAGTNLTRSDLEVLFRQICKDHGLPEPRVNQRVEGREVDFLFAEARLIVETDSWRYHKGRRAFEDDRARDVVTTNAGYRTLRFTDRQLADDPRHVAAAIATTLALDRATA